MTAAIWCKIEIRKRFGSCFSRSSSRSCWILGNTLLLTNSPHSRFSLSSLYVSLYSIYSNRALLTQSMMSCLASYESDGYFLHAHSWSVGTARELVSLQPSQFDVKVFPCMPQTGSKSSIRIQSAWTKLIHKKLPATKLTIIFFMTLFQNKYMFITNNFILYFYQRFTIVDVINYFTAASFSTFRLTMKQYIQTHWTSYALANYFFPKELQICVIDLYARVRIPDDIVDEDWTLSCDEKENLLWQMWEIREKTCTGISWTTDTDFLAHWQEVCNKNHHHQQGYNIPLEYYAAFRKAMLQDLRKETYENYVALQNYMYWSAEVVWLMMTHLIWRDTQYTDETLAWAKLLWEAMQYTNFLRDIHEDITQRWRYYIPLERLEKFWLTHEHLTQYVYWKPLDQNRRSFMKHEISFTKEMYTRANKTIKHLNPSWRKAVFLASKLYEWILDKITRIDYDVFSKNSRTTSKEKLRILMKNYARSSFS